MIIDVPTLLLCAYTGVCQTTALFQLLVSTLARGIALEYSDYLLALYLFDYLLTLSTELRAVWKGDMSVASFVFFVNRYGSLAYGVTGVAASLGLGAWTTSIVRCASNSWKLRHAWQFAQSRR